MEITIRSATKKDRDTIVDFNALLATETEGRSLERAVLQRGVEALLRDPSKGSYYIAEADGNVVGQLMVTNEWSDWRNGNFLWIQSVYVRGNYRGRGVFRKLFEHVRGLMGERKDICGIRLYVEEENEPAKKTYEKLGMKKTAYELYERDFVMGSSSQ